MSLVRSRFTLVTAAALVAAAGLLVAQRSLLGTEADPAAAVTAQEPAEQPLSAVVLVPGYGGSPSSVRSLAAALSAAGHPVSTVTLPGDGTGDIVAMAPVLADAVGRASATGAPVDVVGFSMGGLVARAWARDLGGAAIARRVVTVGTPNAGTETAALGATLGACPTACQQMVPGSELLERLNSPDPTPDGPAWITVRSSTDEVVRPDGTTAMDGASNVLLQEVCSDVEVAHGQLVTQRLSVAIVVRAVAQQPWNTPTTEDCSSLSAG